MITHALFPTLVAEFHYDKKEEFKQRFFNRVHHHMDELGQSTESTGDVDIHHDEELKDIFDFAAKNAYYYLDSLRIQRNMFTLNLVKTWLNILKEYNTVIHTHADAHLSFIYYVNVPKDINKTINFHVNQNINELFHNMFNDNIDEWNIWNSREWFFEPSEGQMFMFPAKLAHYTRDNNKDKLDLPTRDIEELKKEELQ